jgi:hypothetical protein
MNARELEFRKKLIGRMGTRWLCAIHVESHLNPGVPDLSFVMNGTGFETGWLELKSVTSAKQHYTIKVEPSQHRWMRKYAEFVPTYFLIEADTCLYLINGRHHDKLVPPVTVADLIAMSEWWVGDDNYAPTLAMILKYVTYRSR